MFHDRNMEHLTGTGAVNVAAIFKDLLPPGLTRIPGDDSCLDGTEVGNIKLTAILRNKSSADQLRERIRHILIEHFHSIKVTGFNKCAGICEILQMILR